MIEITRAKPEDRAALEALLKRSWLQNWAPHLPPEARERFLAEDPVAEYLDGYLEGIMVARADGAIAGMMHIVDDFLASIHVAAAHHGKGIGSTLMDEAEKLGAKRLEVRAFNERAIRFYCRRGWTEHTRYLDTEMGVSVETLEMRRG